MSHSAGTFYDFELIAVYPKNGSLLEGQSQFQPFLARAMDKKAWLLMGPVG